MFNFTTVVFDGTSPTFTSQTLRDGTPQVQIYLFHFLLFLLSYWHSGLVIGCVTTNTTTTRSSSSSSEYAQMCIHYLCTMHDTM